MMAGHWSFVTFAIISLGSWYVPRFLTVYYIMNTTDRHICQKQFAAERKKLAKVFEATMPKRSLSRPNPESNTNSSSRTPS